MVRNRAPRVENQIRRSVVFAPHVVVIIPLGFGLFGITIESTIRPDMLGFVALAAKRQWIIWRFATKDRKCVSHVAVHSSEIRVSRVMQLDRLRAAFFASSFGAPEDCSTHVRRYGATSEHVTRPAIGHYSDNAPPDARSGIPPV
jgi:hypothetical protein